MSRNILNCVARSAVIALYAALYFVTVGCGDDDDKTVAVGDGSASTDTGQGGTDAGQGGTDAGQNGIDGGQNGIDAGLNETDGGQNGIDAQSSADDGSTETEDNQPVICGETECTVVPEGEPFIKPCCLADKSCGASYRESDECQALNQEGEIDPRCPSHAVPRYNDMSMPGCCKPNGKCGISSSFGFGCVERTQLASYVGGPLPARDCDATD